jgi:hypothetical protein
VGMGGSGRPNGGAGTLESVPDMDDF